MAKVIAVSGAQHAGKGTLLAGLADRGWRVDDFKVSRSVQAELGWSSLSVVKSSPAHMLHFQQKVLDQKLQRDKQLSEEPGEIILTERSFADIVAYTSLWTWTFVNEKQWQLGEALEWLAGFTAKARQAQSTCYHGVILVPLHHDMPASDTDPHRATIASATTVFNDIYEFCHQPSLKWQRRLVLEMLPIDARVRASETFLKELA